MKARSKHEKNCLRRFNKGIIDSPLISVIKVHVSVRKIYGYYTLPYFDHKKPIQSNFV